MDEMTFQGFSLYPFLSFNDNDFEIVKKVLETILKSQEKTIHINITELETETFVSHCFSCNSLQ